MRVSIDHRARYRFAWPQPRVVQLLRMTPSDSDQQTIFDWHIDIDCDARMSSGRDGFGNRTTMLYIDGPVEEVEIIIRGEVLTGDHGQAVSGIHEPFPPAFYTRATALTQPGPAVLAAAQAIAAGGLSSVSLMERLAAQVPGLVSAWPPTSATPCKTADALLNEGCADDRDAAHLLAAFAHAAAMPARVVAGYVGHAHAPALPARQGVRHWVEMHWDGVGWHGFDPVTGARVRRSYVRVAMGLDADDVVPVSGMRLGGGVERVEPVQAADPAGIGKGRA